MTNKSCVMSVILSLAGLLVATDAIQAKHGGRRGCHGGGNGGGGYGGCYGGGYGGGGYGGGYGGGGYGGCHSGGHHGRHSHGGGYGGGYSGGCYGGGHYGQHSHGGCYGGYASSGHHGGHYSYGTNVPQSYAYTNGNSPNRVTTVVPGNSNANVAFYPPNGETNGASPAIPNNAARVRVILPNPQASVFIDGQPTTSTGLVRMFHTPELTTDGSYRIKVSWTADGREQSREKTVAVNPGQMSLADFSQAGIGSEESQETLPRRTQQQQPDAEK